MRIAFSFVVAVVLSGCLASSASEGDGDVDDSAAFVARPIPTGPAVPRVEPPKNGSTVTRYERYGVGETHPSSVLGPTPPTTAR